MIGNDFDIPVMYQDLANYSMGPMSMPGGMMPGIMPNTSYLGGTQMPRQLDHDKVEIMNRKDREAKSTAKKVAIALGVILLAGFIPYFRKNITKAGGIKNYLSNSWNSFKNLFKSNPAPATPSRWQRFKNWFKSKKAPTTPSSPSSSKPSRWQRFKNWFKPKATP